MNALGALCIFIIIIWIGAKIYSWDEKKNDGFGCVFISVVFMIIITILGLLSQCKSCISNSGKEPSYDYYDDKAR